MMLAVASCKEKPSESLEAVPSESKEAVPSESKKVPLASKEAPLTKFTTLFSNDQQEAQDVHLWGKSWVSTSNRKHSNFVEPHKRYHELDLAKMVAHELLPPNDAEIVAIATGAQNQQLALVRDSSGVLMFAKNGKKWKPIKIPKELRASQAIFFHFESDGDELLIVTQDALWHRLEGTWQTLPLGTEGPPYAKISNWTSVALMGSTLYLGFSRGEWGGGIATLDLTSRTWTKAPTIDEMERELPVHGFRQDPSGALWVFEGMRHRTTHDASVRVLKQDGWEDLVRFSSLFDYNTQADIVSNRKNWDEPPMAFLDLAFDATGRIHLLTVDLGILRYEQGKWLRLTQKWFDFSHPVTEYRTGSPPRELLFVDDHTALMPAAEFGVLLWDLKSEKITRIPIEKELDEVNVVEGAE
jgi:hypothetical protein